MWCSVLIAILSMIGIGRFFYLSSTRVDQRQSMYKYVIESNHPGIEYLIPPNWQGFRLATGTPIYVDHKSHPFKDTAIIDWYRRLNNVERLFATNDCELLDSIASNSAISHIAVPVNSPCADCPQVEIEWSDELYTIGHFKSSVP